ncbi:GTP cyclohydrolase II [Arcobacter sp. HD9-500m-PIT-SAG03]|nr:GTP cyclohydrolase II [Arcobacter sp. HD9-500m-PIT-SAG03]
MVIDFEKGNGLVPVVTQEYGSNEILMLGYMNQEALDLSAETKVVHYFSRSKNRIWKKGESSGNIQKILDLKVDCDNDTILAIVEQVGNSACHTGAKSCFFKSYLGNDQPMIVESKIANLPTKYGDFDIKAYKDADQEHLAVMSKNFKELKTPHVRIHSECLTGDSVGSLKCDCNKQLVLALELIAKEGGLVIYHRQEGRNIGLVNKINAYNLQDQGYNTVEANVKLGFKADERDYRAVGFILKDLGLKEIKLMTNNPTKIDFVKSCGIKIHQRMPSITQTNQHNEHYLQTKKEHMGHLL